MHELLDFNAMIQYFQIQAILKIQLLKLLIHHLFLLIFYEENHIFLDYYLFHLFYFEFFDKINLLSNWKIIIINTRHII